MRTRLLSGLVLRRLEEFPAVALSGARQCGKTTLARSFGGRYFDLEQAEDRLRVDLEWNGLVTGRELVILDEAQAWPEIFPRIRGAIDADRRRAGRFLLLGSVSPALLRGVTESLAGRLALLELTGFLVLELPSTRHDALWLRGGYPDGGVLGKGGYPAWHESYLSLLARRDLPDWGMPALPATTERLFRMLAVAHGRTWNGSDIGRSLGLSYHTVATYLDWLEGAFLVRRLQPFHKSIGKRLVRSPRVWWRDSGLLHRLLGLTEEARLLDQPWVGASWEGWIIEQTLSTLAARGVSHEAFFFRTSDGKEIDLLIETGGDRWAIEVKLTTNPAPDDLARLDTSADLVSARYRVLLSRTTHPSWNGTRGSVDLRTLLGILPGGQVRIGKGSRLSVPAATASERKRKPSRR